MGRAEQTLAAAGALFEAGFYLEVVSRCYYAMFYAAKAALALQGVHVHKHSAVISAFGRNLANTGFIPRRMHRALIAAFKDRGAADYDLGWEPTREKAQLRMSETEEFVSEVGRYLRSQ